MVENEELFVEDDNGFKDEDDFGAVTESQSEKIETVPKKFELQEMIQNLSKPAIAIGSAGITLVFCIIVGLIIHAIGFNSYNANKDGYLVTLKEQAAEHDMTVGEYKESLGLPRGMRGDTVAAVASMYMPAAKYIEMNHGMSFEMVIDAMGLSDDKRISPKMRYGELEKIMKEAEKSKSEDKDKASEKQKNGGKKDE